MEVPRSAPPWPAVHFDYDHYYEIGTCVDLETGATEPALSDGVCANPAADVVSGCCSPEGQFLTEVGGARAGWRLGLPFDDVVQSDIDTVEWDVWWPNWTAADTMFIATAEGNTFRIGNVLDMTGVLPGDIANTVDVAVMGYGDDAYVLCD
ncbi:MAG: hypothetical protein ACI8PZ_007497 [Myxococcota bacterium]|jgi:hypothetical protein